MARWEVSFSPRAPAQPWAGEAAASHRLDLHQVQPVEPLHVQQKCAVHSSFGHPALMSEPLGQPLGEPLAHGALGQVGLEAGT